MSRLEFNDIVKDVASFFGSPKEQQMEILYDIFKVYPYDQMKRACRFLIEHHDHRFFPSPREIHDALREVAELKTPPATLEDTPDSGYDRCHTCSGAGMMVEDRTQGEYQYHVAVYCDCPKGQKMRQGHREYMKRNHNAGGEV
jgi:hypothetical protein